MTEFPKNIVLIGLMGAGKTSIGRALAKDQDSSFFDIDDIITEEQGKPIPQIFEDEGEPYFRDIERHTTINTVQNSKNAIISLGGGAFMNDETRAFVKENAISVFLKADLATLIKRVGMGEGRPLLKNNPEKTLQSLIDARYAIYEQADFIIESKDEPLEETVKRVTETLYKAGALS